jgi:hypothetical protein
MHFVFRLADTQLAFANRQSPIWNILLHLALSLLQKDVPNHRPQFISSPAVRVD